VRVVFFIQHLGVGGVVRQLSLTSDGLGARGHDTALVALYTIDPGWKPLWRSDEVVAFRGRPPTSAVVAAAQVLSATLRLRRLARRRNADVLYAYEGNVARLVAWLATRFSSTTVVWGVQGAGRSYGLRREWKLGLPFLLCKAVSGSVPLMIANSQAGHARRLALGFRCPKQLAIPNGFDTDSFRPDPDARARVRADWGLGDELLIGLVGRIDPVKGHATFLAAAALLASRRDDVRFVIVGDGPAERRRELERRARELGLASRLLWAGRREDMPAVYNALDVLCSASVREGFPNVIGEAMSCGVPCVATDAGDSARLIAETGIVVPPGDPSLLAGALETMLAELPERRALDVRRRIEDRFGLEAWIDATEAALSEVRAAG
jgi:glycosyltransferase involved in cell wall biosynthesis